MNVTGNEGVLELKIMIELTASDELKSNKDVDPLRLLDFKMKEYYDYCFDHISGFLEYFVDDMNKEGKKAEIQKYDQIEHDKNLYGKGILKKGVITLVCERQYPLKPYSRELNW